MSAESGCLCGTVRYEVAGELGPVVYCHCSQCRRAGGSAFAANAFVRSADLRVTQGRDAIAEYESSPGQLRAFCSRCGSPLYSRLAADPGALRIRLGALERDPRRRALAHVWVGSKAPWFAIADTLPRFEQGFPALRPFQPADLAETIAMWHASRRAAFPYNAEQQRHTLEDDTRFFREVVAPRCRVLLALEDGRIAGFIAVRDEWIEHLFVRTDLQRCGFGTALLAQAMTLSPALLRLFTFQRNAAARAFYEKHGFTAVAFGVSAPPESEPDVEYRFEPGRVER